MGLVNVLVRFIKVTRSGMYMFIFGNHIARFEKTSAEINDLSVHFTMLIDMERKDNHTIAI